VGANVDAASLTGNAEQSSIERMAFDIQFAQLATDDIDGLDARWRSAVLTAIETHLRFEPAKESRSRIKRLSEVENPQYRLRVDDLRVFYDIEESTVRIIAVVNKRDAAQWLKEHSEPSHDSSSDQPSQ
jgi:mRNA interferase RelE/StbE